jgi:hypothetical protein
MEYTTFVSSLAHSLNNLDANTDEYTQDWLEQHHSRLKALSKSDKSYYNSYVSSIVHKLQKYIGATITAYHLKSPDIKEPYDLILEFDKSSKNDESGSDEDDEDDEDNDDNNSEKKKEIFLSFNPDNIYTTNTIKVSNFILECGFTKRKGFYKEFLSAYEKITSDIYKIFKGKEKYSDLDKEFLDKNIYEPVINHIVRFLRKKRSCVPGLFKRLMGDDNRLVVELNESRFNVYDMRGKAPDVESCEIDNIQEKSFDIAFDELFKFRINLYISDPKVKENIGLRLDFKMLNLNQIYRTISEKI